MGNRAIASPRTGTLPASLSAIREEATRNRLPASDLERLHGAWQAHVSRATQQIEDLNVQGQGETLCLGELSPGCQACKDGTWDCIFTTMRCSLDCDFCYSPHDIARDYAGSLMGATREEIAENHDRTQIRGVSFSGGEPFEEPEKLFRWVAWFTSRHPLTYYWVYTNGLHAVKPKLRRLAQLGVDEIRFNLAATGYDHPAVLENLAAAARLIPTVTVEIPAIPEHAAKLLSCLEGWAGLGVKFLNLHELLYEPGTNSASMTGPRWSFVTEDGHRSAINPESRLLTLAVMQRVQDDRLPLSVNDCSLQSKIRQLRGRRRNLVPLVKAPHEKLVRDQVYESYCAFQNGDEVSFFHPDARGEMCRRLPDHRFARMVRTAPLSIHDPGKWIVFEQWVP
jgi:pyruvate formate-lyase activating enzyme-like uncharacterized protein